MLCAIQWNAHVLLKGTSPQNAIPPRLTQLPEYHVMLLDAFIFQRKVEVLFIKGTLEASGGFWGAWGCSAGLCWLVEWLQKADEDSGGGILAAAVLAHRCGT